ncbi:gamma-tubulin complex component 5 isoform X2 [Amborella trichopoda]|uniref:gamma-tubulin complex component 5 isoform X2 n=1 Tax=Amborella trichopoda TaxID=13333 RepID=UPI0005D3EA18|nr:gamma-tubulin complex component 5 isoform X2 [Amborella trichopoda]|eukprot:XP_020529750.1 gamma-tubulin complex component 5 isoform X2 [Amborella trichopoda]
MENPVDYVARKPGTAQTLAQKLYNIHSKSLPFAAPESELEICESKLVQCLLRMMQGYSSLLFYWEDRDKMFCIKNAIHVNHLSKSSLNSILHQFIYGATCLRLVELFVKQVENSSARFPPTLKAFTNSVSAKLKRLRGIALKVEKESAGSSNETTLTLLGLVKTLSSVCSGAEYLLQVVHGAIPHNYFECTVPAGEVAVHILDHLYKKLNEVCLVQGGEEEAYHTLLALFVGSLQPLIEGLDSWLYEGTLDDPFEELFFYANNSIGVDDATFWEKSYLMRPLRQRKLNCAPIFEGKSRASNKRGISDAESNVLSMREKDGENYEIVFCPLFIQRIAKAIVSAGKSLQLIRHIYGQSKNSMAGPSLVKIDPLDGPTAIQEEISQGDTFLRESDSRYGGRSYAWKMGRLTLFEMFSVSLVGLIGDDCHIYKGISHQYPWSFQIDQLCELFMNKTELEGENGDSQRKNWESLIVDIMWQKDPHVHIKMERLSSQCEVEDINGNIEDPLQIHSFWPANPAITACRNLLDRSKESWDKLNVSRSFYLPPLNDWCLREAIFGDSGLETNNVDEFTEGTECIKDKERISEALFSQLKGTNYILGFGIGKSEHHHEQNDTRTLESLFPFPTLLPCLTDYPNISQLLPYQKNSTLATRVLNWIESIELKVDFVGKHILLKLMDGWRLMDELGLLRAIYLFGSGDLLQQLLTVLFDKLDRGEYWDDDFELNTLLQESIRNSADGMLLSIPDSLVVTISKHPARDGEHALSPVSTPKSSRNHSFGIGALDPLQFTYKVSWPLELIANQEAIKKYNQVMNFLMKVKRAKFVLDKARRWTWKDRGATNINQKRHLLLEQKLLHFVDAFHQYVMDRVLHSAWLELCEGMASAGSLDEVIEVHESYILSVQRQCFVAPDKLWAMIASRIRSILGLALDFHSIQHTLCSGGAAPAIKARCELEVDRVERQFDECIAFLLRVLSFKLNVGHFPHLVDLVTRINYNYFYMSDTGNLLTMPTSDVSTSKPGQPNRKNPPSHN